MPAARMRDVIGHSAKRTSAPAVEHVEHQRHMHANRRMQRTGRIPRLEPHAADELAFAVGGAQRHRAAVAGEHETFVDPTGHPRLHPLDRTVDVTNRPGGAGFLAQHVPGFQRGAQFDLGVVHRHGPDMREAERQMRREPRRIERMAARMQFIERVGEIPLDIMRQHEIVVHAGAPADQLPLVRVLPERGDGGAHQQHLRRRHARARRHFQRAELDQAAPPGRAIRRVQLVDAELGAMRVAGHVRQDVAEQTVGHPRRHGLSGVDLRERDLQFGEAVLPRLVDPRMLAGRADELAAEQKRQAGMIVPEPQ